MLLWQLPGQVHLGFDALGQVHLGGEAATMAAITEAVGDALTLAMLFGASMDGIVGGGILMAADEVVEPGMPLVAALDESLSIG